MGHVTCNSFFTHTRIGTTKLTRYHFTPHILILEKMTKFRNQESPFLPKINNKVLKLQYPKMGWESKTKELNGLVSISTQ
jgi:hypothetical protein